MRLKAVQRRLTTGVLVTLTVSGMLWLSGSTFEDESGTGRGFHPEIIAIVTPILPNRKTSNSGEVSTRAVKPYTNGQTDGSQPLLIHGTSFDLTLCNASQKVFRGTFNQNLRKLQRLTFRGADKWIEKLGLDKNRSRDIPSFPVLVTAASSGFFDRSQGLIKSVHEALIPKYPELKFVYYDLGLNADQKKRILFQEFGHVWWADASVRFTTNDLDGPVQYLKQTGSLFFTYDKTLSVAKHTVLQTFNYFEEHPCPYNEFGEIEAGNIAFYDKHVSRIILRNWVSCALIQDCIAPPGSHTGCSRVSQTVGSCHRYDQSILSIILRRLYHDQNDYPLVEKPFKIVKVMRGSRVNYLPKLKNNS